MPIETNFALTTGVYHKPLPATKAEHRHLQKALQSHPNRLGARYDKGCIVLEPEAAFIPEAVPEEVWQVLGKIIQKAMQPWWDFCMLVADSKPQAASPHAHALSLIRVYPDGSMAYLWSEDAGGGS